MLEADDSHVNWKAICHGKLEVLFITQYSQSFEYIFVWLAKNTRIK